MDKKKQKKLSRYFTRQPGAPMTAEKKEKVKAYKSHIAKEAFSQKHQPIGAARKIQKAFREKFKKQLDQQHMYRARAVHNKSIEARKQRDREAMARGHIKSEKFTRNLTSSQKVIKNVLEHTKKRVTDTEYKRVKDGWEAKKSKPKTVSFAEYIQRQMQQGKVFRQSSGKTGRWMWLYRRLPTK